MPDINVSTGTSYWLPNQVQPRNKFSATESLFNTAKNIKEGFLDENIIALSTIYASKYIFNSNPTYELDNNYNIFEDQQIDNAGLSDYVGNFMHSRNEEHTRNLIERFIEKNKRINGSPSYIIGRILGGLTDPTSLFLFTKAGSTLLRLNRLKRGMALGGIIGTEEIGKRYFDDSRPMIDSVLITAGGFIVPALFPNLPAAKGAKNFDKHYNMYDQADDAVFNNKGTLSAASPRGTRLKTEEDFQDLNKIQPTGTGIFGEQGPWNPIFRTFKDKTSSAQDFMERSLESPLYQKKNFADIATSPSIERSIKMRYPNLVVNTMKELESFYATYLQRMGKNKQTFVERTFDTKFYRNTNEGKKVLSPSEFREAVWESRLGIKEVPEEARLAAQALDKFYKPIGKEYDSLEITNRFIEKQIATIDSFINKIKSNSKKTKYTAIKKRLEERLKYIQENSSLIKDNYINMVFKRDVIESKFADFQIVMQKILRNKGIPDEQIDEIINQFKHYQPVIPFPNLADEIKLAKKGKMTVDVDKYLDSINKVSARFRSRDLGLKNEDYIELAKLGYIEKDVQVLTKLYFNQTIPDIEITKVFGDPMGFGTQWSKAPEKWQRGIKQISEEYDELIENASTAAKANKLIKQQEEALIDLDSSIALLRGTYGLGPDPNRTLSRGIRLMKLYNSMTMLTGLAQVVDTARLISINGINKSFKLSWEVMTSGYAKEVAKMSKNTTQLGGEALDMWNSSRAMAMYGMDDAFGVFNKFEKGASSLGNLYFTFLNLSNPWNTMVKSTAGFFNGTRMLEAIEGLITTGKISKVNKARLKNLGIDDDMAKIIWKEYVEHGVGKGAKKSWNQYNDSYKIMRVANSEAWTNQKAADVFHQAIGKQANIDIVTPSKGDVPLWANTELGGIITQFKKFGMASTQRMLLRGLQEKDANFLSGVLLLLAAGAMVDAYRQRAFNRSYAKKPRGQKLVDAFDRSGLGGIYSDINNAIERLANNEIGLRPLLGAKKPYGTYRDLINNPVPDVLGPTASQLSNIADIMWTTGSGKYNHHTARNVRRLLPFQNVWFLDSLFDEIETKGLR